MQQKLKHVSKLGKGILKTCYSSLYGLVQRCQKLCVFIKQVSTAIYIYIAHSIRASYSSFERYYNSYKKYNTYDINLSYRDNNALEP